MLTDEDCMPCLGQQATKNAPINRSASSRCRGRIRSAACSQSNRAASRPNRPRVPSAGINRFRCNGYVLSRTRQHPDSRGRIIVEFLICCYGVAHLAVLLLHIWVG